MSNKQRFYLQEDLNLPKSFSPYTYNIFIKQFVDRYNYGYLKNFVFSTERINKVWAGELWPSHIELKRDSHIVTHLEREEVYFYTSNPYSEVGMLVIDLDATSTSSYADIEKAAQYIIDRYHPGAYYDQSTNGEGIHLYFFLNVTGYFQWRYGFFMPLPLRLPEMHTIRDYLNSPTYPDRPGKSYKALLKELIEVVDIYCKICGIKGTFPSYQGQQYEPGYAITHRGTLCKLPWPRSESEFMELVHSPILSFDDILSNSEAIEREIKRLRWEYDGIGEEPPIIITEPLIPTPTPKPVEPSESLPDEPDQPVTPTPNVQSKTSQTVYQQCNDTNAFTKTRKSIMYLARELGRIPEYDQWNEFYEYHGLATPPETPERRKRFENCVKYIAQTFDPTRGQRSDYEIGEFMDDLKQRITPQELKDISPKGRRIRYEDLDMVMGYHWICISGQHINSPYLFSVRKESLLKWFEKQHSQGLCRFGLHPNKLSPIRDLLQHIEYLTLIDPDYGKNRKCMRWGVGRECPRYQQYLESGKAFIESRLREIIEDTRQLTEQIERIMLTIECMQKDLDAAADPRSEESIQADINQLKNRVLVSLEDTLSHNKTLIKYPGQLLYE